MNRDRFYMQLALETAPKGAGTASPNPMVGAVVVKDGRVVGRGYHKRAGAPHAEIEALREAGELARGADLYVTLEPCNHTGKTPPCTEAILAAGIRRVISAMPDPNPNVTGGGHRYLAERGLEVVTGVCEKEARHLNEAFITYAGTGKPLVVLKVAATLDGRIATRTGDSKWVSGEASRQFVHRLRHRMDAILVGVGTVRADDPSLTTRLNDETGVDPLRIIVDTHLSIPSSARVLHLPSPARTLIVTGHDVPEDRRDRIEGAGADILEADTDDRGIDLKRLVARLGSLGITSLLIEGGSRVAASAVAAGIVDKLYLFLAPKLLGGDKGIPIFGGQDGPESMQDSLPVSNIRIRRFGEDVLVEGDLRKDGRNG